MIKSYGKLTYKPFKNFDQTIALYVTDIHIMGKDMEVTAIDVNKPFTFYYSGNNDKWYVPDPNGEDRDCYKEFDGTVVSFEYRYCWDKE